MTQEKTQPIEVDFSRPQPGAILSSLYASGFLSSSRLPSLGCESEVAWEDAFRSRALDAAPRASWLIFLGRHAIDRGWADIAESVAGGQLSRVVCKAAASEMGRGRYVIHVMLPSVDRESAMAVRKTLRSMGFLRKLPFADVATRKTLFRA